MIHIYIIKISNQIELVSAPYYLKVFNVFSEHFSTSMKNLFILLIKIFLIKIIIPYGSLKQFYLSLFF
jgi:hypothetical protein